MENFPLKKNPQNKNIVILPHRANEREITQKWAGGADTTSPLTPPQEGTQNPEFLPGQPAVKTCSWETSPQCLGLRPDRRGQVNRGKVFTGRVLSASPGPSTGAAPWTGPRCGVHSADLRGRGPVGFSPGGELTGTMFWVLSLFFSPAIPSLLFLVCLGMDVKFCHRLFLCQLSWSYSFSFLSLLIWWIILIDFQTQEQPCLPGINLSWLSIKPELGNLYYPLCTLLDSIFWYFDEDFCLCLFCFAFPYNIAPWFWY